MPTQLSARILPLVAACLAGTPTIGCSKESERPVRLETGVSVSTRAESVATSPETSVVAPKPDTAASVQPVSRKPLVHPTRKAPRETTRAAAAKPASATSDTAQTGSAQDKWLSYDAASNTVTFELIAGPFTFNGYRNGEGTLIVPPKANIVMNFVNKDGTPHSAILISGEGPIPNSADTPAIPRAYTNKALEGLPQEATDVMRFPAPESGSYRIFCGVPGHGSSGMWIWMKIDPAAKTPSFGPTKV
jgi:hypothetical protein